MTRDAEYVPREIADQLYEALRLTREYVGADLLPAVKGWSWYDAMSAYEGWEEQRLIDGSDATR